MLVSPARWPADGSARQTLLGARGKLEASDIVEGTKEVGLRDEATKDISIYVDICIYKSI